jgi:hypothetical protein
MKTKRKPLENIPLLPDPLIVENVLNVSFFPDTQSLTVQTEQSERGTKYRLMIEIRQMALREIVLALKDIEARLGKSIEDLTKPPVVQ